VVGSIQIGLIFVTAALTLIAAALQWRHHKLVKANPDKKGSFDSLDARRKLVTLAAAIVGFAFTAPLTAYRIMSPKQESAAALPAPSSPPSFAPNAEDWPNLSPEQSEDVTSRMLAFSGTTVQLVVTPSRAAHWIAREIRIALANAGLMVDVVDGSPPLWPGFIGVSVSMWPIQESVRVRRLGDNAAAARLDKEYERSIKAAWALHNALHANGLMAGVPSIGFLPITLAGRQSGSDLVPPPPIEHPEVRLIVDSSK
jgi:hypothetical protein